MIDIPAPMTRIELRVLKQVRSGYARGVISPGIREKLRSMGLIDETERGLIVTDEGLRRIESSRGPTRRSKDQSRPA